MPTAVLERPVEASRSRDLLENEDDVEFEPKPHVWTREEYYRAADMGVFGEWPHIELIEGEIVDMSPMYSPHATTTQRVRRALAALEDEGRHLRFQLPLSIGSDFRPSDPEPDAALVAGDIEDYAPSHPSTALLVVEVSESSLKRDRGWKSSLYAAAGVREYWIVNVIARELEVRREPRSANKARFGANYSHRKICRPDDVVTCLAAPETEIAVASFFQKQK